uniref:LUC7-like (S. cerevisiae) n=2 Tax=Cyprinus carpio TaxID=7962 RepID=A0A9J7Z4Z3_CYPCA
MSAQAQMRALLDQLMGTSRDGSVYVCQPTSARELQKSLMFIEPFGQEKLFPLNF